MAHFSINIRYVYKRESSKRDGVLTRESVRPSFVVFKTIIGAEVHDHGFAFCTIDRVDVGFADAVGEGHDPSVDFPILLHTVDVIDGECLVGDGRFGVTFELRACEFAGGDVREFKKWVVVQEGDESLAGEASCADQGDAFGFGSGGIGSGLGLGSGRNADGSSGGG